MLSDMHVHLLTRGQPGHIMHDVSTFKGLFIFPEARAKCLLNRFIDTWKSGILPSLFYSKRGQFGLKSHPNVSLSR